MQQLAAVIIELQHSTEERQSMYLSATIYDSFVFDFDAFWVCQHERPQHQAPHIHQVEQCLIHGVLLHDHYVKSAQFGLEAFL